MKFTNVILAAGKGTRMKSDIPKVLHPLLGYPMLWYSLKTARELSDEPPVVVVGHQAEAVMSAVGDERVRFALQDPQLGTGDALNKARQLIPPDTDTIIVTYGDMPLLRSETLARLLDAHASNKGPMTIMTVVMDDPHGFGRIVRDGGGRVLAIVEEAHATPEQKAIRELNTGIYAIDAGWAWDHLPKLPLSPKGEYYLTDLVEMAVSEGLPVESIEVEDPDEVVGINTRVHLAQAESILRNRINTAWMLEGVTIVDPDTTYIEPEVSIGRDSVIHPNTYLKGRTSIGENSIIGPNTLISDSSIGSRCEVRFSVIEGAIIEDDVDVGPFAHLRKGAHLAKGVHMGNFGEVKNSYLGPGTKMGHFSYIGDARIGRNVNIGAGTITCNYDGEKKNPTYIEDDVFIGSDTMLVAPVKIGRGSKTGAGSVVTKDIPPSSLAYGVPARVKKSLEEK